VRALSTQHEPGRLTSFAPPVALPCLSRHPEFGRAGPEPPPAPSVKTARVRMTRGAFHREVPPPRLSLSLQTKADEPPLVPAGVACRPSFRHGFTFGFAKR